MARRGERSGRRRPNVLALNAGIALLVAAGAALLGALAALAGLVPWLPWSPLVSVPLLLAAGVILLSGPTGVGRIVVAVVLALAVAAIPAAGWLRGDLVGRMIAVDDTGLPPTPIEDGWILVLPAGHGTWELLEAGPGTRDFEHLGGGVGLAEVTDAGGHVQPIGRWGRFDLPVEPGEWVLCHAPRRSEGELRLRGCRVAVLPDRGLVEASWGEGGFGVRTVG